MHSSRRARDVLVASGLILLVATSAVGLACDGDKKHSVPDGPGPKTPNESDAAPGSICAEFGAGSESGTVLTEEITEASGLAASSRGVLWVNNDSGDRPRLLAIRPDGALAATLEIPSATAVDWEDLAIGPGEGGVDYLYAADIGDNDAKRKDVVVYRVSEPSLPSEGPPVTRDATPLPITLTYPDGAHDAETLLVDPTSGDLFIVTKSKSGGSGVYRAAAPQVTGPRVLEHVGDLQFGKPPLEGNMRATGGSVSRTGDLVVIRTYDHVFGWTRNPGESIAQALVRPPCELPSMTEPQGESVAIAADGRGYFTLSEGTSQVLWFFARR